MGPYASEGDRAVALVKKLPVSEPPRVLTIEDIDLRGAIEDAFRALEATTLLIDGVLEALQEAREITRLACRADARAKRGLLVHRYETLTETIGAALTKLANGPIASGNAALAITLAQTGMADDELMFDLPASLGNTSAEARETLAALEAAMRATEIYAGHFRETAHHLVEHRAQTQTRH